MDKKAYTILKKHYEWKLNKKEGKRIPYFPTPEEVQYVSDVGLPIVVDYNQTEEDMFGGKQNCTTISHDEATKRLLAAYKNTKLIQASNAFLYSISSKAVEFRTGLPAFAYAMHFPKHDFKKSDKSSMCRICGMEKKDEFDFSEKYYRKFDWGNGLRNNPMEPAFDLEFFNTLPEVQPTNTDIKLFKSIITLIEKSDPEDTARAIENKTKDILKGNKYTREYFFETLGVCGILETEDFKGYDKEFMTIWKSQGGNSRPNKFVECDPPLSFWKAKDGINWKSLHYFFPQIDWKNK